jgi:hypothetical protein
LELSLSLESVRMGVKASAKLRGIHALKMESIAARSISSSSLLV